MKRGQSCEFLGVSAVLWDHKYSYLPLRPVIRVGIGHVRDRIEVQRAMCFEEVLTVFFGEGIDLFLFMRIKRISSVAQGRFLLHLQKILGLLNAHFQ